MPTARRSCWRRAGASSSRCGRRDRPVPARIRRGRADRRRCGPRTRACRPATRPMSRTGSPGGWRPGAARGRWRSSTSSTAPGGSSSRRGSTSSVQEGMDRLLGLDLGDLIGVDGVAFSSRRGELTLRVEDFTLLAKSLRPPPEKHHGLTDVETRFRRRELDLIANEEARELFITRARVITAVRRFLDAEGFIEVETPVLQPLYGGAAGPAVHDPPQRARSRVLPAYRHRALPEAADRRRARARVRARQGLPQRGRRHHAQPRVHDARVVRGVRRLRGHRVALRAAGRVRRRPRSATRAQLDLSPPWRRERLPEAILDRTGIDIMELRDRDDARSRDDRPRAAASRRTTRGRSWSTSCSPSTSSRR